MIFWAFFCIFDKNVKNMKLRVIKRVKDGCFEPQYLDENGKFGPTWRECHLTNNLVCVYYHNVDDAIEVCKKYKETHQEDEVVWEG